MTVNGKMVQNIMVEISSDELFSALLKNFGRNKFDYVNEDGKVYWKAGLDENYDDIEVCAGDEFDGKVLNAIHFLMKADRKLKAQEVFV